MYNDKKPSFLSSLATNFADCPRTKMPVHTSFTVNSCCITTLKVVTTGREKKLRTCADGYIFVTQLIFRWLYAAVTLALIFSTPDLSR